jgi:transcriptional regulator with XRE-family HTH domain
MKKRIAWNIRTIRVRLGLSQIQLAGDSDLDTSYISRIERGLENPTITTLNRISKALGVSTVDLLAKPRGKKPKTLRGGRKPK